MSRQHRPIIELNYNGDPYGGGFLGYEIRDDAAYNNPDDAANFGLSIYRGDIGAQPRSWWRWFCRCMGYTLREVR